MTKLDIDTEIDWNDDLNEDEYEDLTESFYLTPHSYGELLVCGSVSDLEYDSYLEQSHLSIKDYIDR